MKNYVVEADLKGYIPALAKLLWVSETSFSKQQVRAEQIVYGDLIDKGYTLRKLQVPDVLDESESIESDNMRFVVTPSTTTGTVTLLGSDDNETFEDVVTLTFTTATEQTSLLTTTYKYYMVESTGGIEYTASLVETNFDLLFACKWLELILIDAMKNEGDQYHLKAQYFMGLYNDKLNKMQILYDGDDDGEQDIRNSSIIERTL